MPARLFAGSQTVSSLLIAFAVLGATAPAFAQTDAPGASDESMSKLTFRDKFTREVVLGSQLHGRLGVYDFRRFHNINQPFPGQTPAVDDFDDYNTSPGAQIGVQTGRIYGFSLGGEFIYHGTFYGNNDQGTRLNCNLTCGQALTRFTQGFAQFNAYGAQVRAGRQLLNTPLAAADQFTFIPRAFEGVSATWEPLESMQRMSPDTPDDADTPRSGPQITRDTQPAAQNFETDQFLALEAGAAPMDRPMWQVFGAAISRYSSRFGDAGFVDANRYLQDVDGFWSAGTSVRTSSDTAGQFIAQYYHYDFDEVSQADYGEVGYMLPTHGDGPLAWAPFARAQVTAAYDADKGRIPQGINSQIYGLKIGIDTPMIGFSIFGNFSPEHDGSFNDGQLLHPYTDLSGVNYTDTMNNGIDEIGPGWAAGGRFDFTPNDDLAIYARYVQFQAQHGHYHDFLYFGPYQQISDDSFIGDEVDDQKSDVIGLGITYDLGGIWDQLAGLKVNSNFNVTRYEANAPNFYTNRARIFYQF